jgi:GTPase SAR1 family protein
MTQIIDGDGNILPTLETHPSTLGITSLVLQYHIISIVGPQSSGKSTLLNELFNTTFATMDDTLGRQQTTLGIHSSYSAPGNLLLFDVEGSDSRERGDQDCPFDRKTALFALSLSELLIINMWKTDLGRQEASSYSLLKTIFESIIQLFVANQEVKVTVLFIVRDCSAQNFQPFAEGLKTDIDTIWSTIQLPHEYQHRTIADFFKFEFISLSSYKDNKDEFDHEVQQLKTRFVNREAGDYFFPVVSSKLVPGDGLAQYVRQLWGTIHANKKLNVPSQRSISARFKCQEKVNSEVPIFEQFLKSSKLQLSK